MPGVTDIIRAAGIVPRVHIIKNVAKKRKSEEWTPVHHHVPGSICTLWCHLFRTVDKNIRIR
jgi:hypothetical protein